MAHVKVRGILLRLVKVKDSDAYLTLLTGELGLVEVYAKRLRTRTSKLWSKCQLFSFGDFILFENKGRYSLDDVDVVYAFQTLREDLFTLTAASQIAEMLIDQTHEPDEAELFYPLFIRYCYAVDQGKKDPLWLTYLSQMKIMDEAGYQPRLLGCAACGKSPSPVEPLYFDYNYGSILCDRDAKKGQEHYRSDIGPISYDLYRVLSYVEQSPVDKLFLVEGKDDLIAEFGFFIRHYLEVRLDKSYDKFEAFRDFGF